MHRVTLQHTTILNLNQFAETLRGAQLSLNMQQAPSYILFDESLFDYPFQDHSL